MLRANSSARADRLDSVRTGETMNRRQVLIAGGLAAFSSVASGKTDLRPLGGGGTPTPVGTSAACALIPIEYSQRQTSAPIGEMRVARYWPAQSSSRLALWNLDLQVYDQANIPQWVYAWQLRRSASGIAIPGNNLRMLFPTGARIDMMLTVRSVDGIAQVFNARVPSGVLAVLATARQGSGRLPELTELRYDASKMDLYLADGSPRDFDALLIQTT
jgi:hypothetical protein